jgi:hypothetical protein
MAGLRRDDVLRETTRDRIQIDIPLRAVDCKR